MLKTSKKILSTIMVVIMVLTAVPLSGFVGIELPTFDWGIKASAKTVDPSGQCGENVYWTYDSTTKELVISGTGLMNGYSNSNTPFYNSDIKTVVIENGVTSIGNYAFYKCSNLSTLTIPNSVTYIGYNALSGCSSLDTLILGMKEIHSNEFKDINTIKTVTLTEGVEKIGDYAFSGCSHLESINFPDSLIFMGKDILKNTAWFNYRGKGLIVYDDWAYGFKGSQSGDTVTLSENIKGVADKTFTGDKNIVAFVVDEDNPYLASEDGVLFNKERTVLMVYPSGKSSLSYTIPNTVEEIRADAFYNNHLVNIHISDLETWCKIDFANASANPIIKYGTLYIDKAAAISIDIPNTITEIKPYAFYSYDNLLNVTIPDSVTTIGGYAFAGCIGIRNIDFGEKVEMIGEHAFDECYSLTSVTFSDSVTTIGNYAFSECYNIHSVTLGKGLQKVGYYAFDMCDNLKDVYYPGSQEEWEKINIHEEEFHITNADLYLMHTHEYTKTVIKEPSCTSDGEILYTCKHGDTKTEIVTAIGHNMVDMGGSVKATCTTNGINNYKCSNCGEENKGTTPALDHNWKYLENTYATCNKDGYMSRVCLREGCNAKEEKVTPVTHDLEVWNKKLSSCTETGEKHISCMECSYSYVEEIPATGHYFYWDIIKSATCTTTGERKKHCEECNYSSEIEIIPAKGHTYSEWFELLPATCSERGLNIKICDDCNDIQRQIIPKLAHVDADGNGVCDNCDTDTPEEPDAPEEPDTPEVPDTPDIPDEPEEEPCDCDCHAGGIKAFFFNFLNFFAKLFNKDARTCECGAAH